MLQLKQPRLANWWVRSPLMPVKQIANSKANRAGMDALYAQRIRSLVSVDEMLDALHQQVGGCMHLLDAAGLTCRSPQLHAQMVAPS